LEIIQADAIARYHRLLGEEVVFNTGTDEHGLKIYRKAAEEGKDTQAYCDEYAAKFHALKEALNLSYTNFIRTTDANHKAAAQEFWRLCLANGDIYKKNYQVKYCVGCELEKTDSELVDNKCPIHPKLEIEMINEENYFFRWSKYQQALLDLYRERPDFVVPPHRLTLVKPYSNTLTLPCQSAIIYSDSAYLCVCQIIDVLLTNFRKIKPKDRRRHDEKNSSVYDALRHPRRLLLCGGGGDH
jgi:methionyl-tRNA synthetase